MPRIGLSGAIAVGKSTLAAHLAEGNPSIQVHQEDVAEFRFLQEFYAAPDRFAFHSRVEFLSIKADELARSVSNADTTTLLDRVLPELITFARSMRKSGLLSSDEFALYEKLYRSLNSALPKFDAFIWVRCDTEECLSRIARRGRPFEQAISANYLNDLDREYQEWVAQLTNTPVLFVDTTRRDPSLTSRTLEWLSTNGLVR